MVIRVQSLTNIEADKRPTDCARFGLRVVPHDGIRSHLTSRVMPTIPILDVTTG